MLLESPSLLITDDDRCFRQTIRDVFSGRGFQTYLAADGEEALEIVESAEVHVVLCDMHMPRITGVETIRRIKQLDARMPCILISAALNDELRQESLAFSVLSKPVSYLDVTETVSSALRTIYGWPKA